MEQKKIQEALNLDIFFQSLLQIAEETDERYAKYFLFALVV